MSDPNPPLTTRTRKRRAGDSLMREVKTLVPWTLLMVVALTVIAVIAPQQLGVIIYGLAKLAMGAILGFLVDRTAFPQSQPEIEFRLVKFLADLHREGDEQALARMSMAVASHMLRRATLIGLAMIALCLAP